MFLELVRNWLLDCYEPPKVIAERACKHVSSAEKGVLVTFLAFINACGNTVPPVFIFPRVHFQEFMLTGAPAGSLAMAHPSGRMTEEHFIQSLGHFVKHTKPTAESPILILMKNHNTHVNINVVTFASQNNLIILTLPPHCSRRMQPLDVAVYGPFKMRYRRAMNDWSISNPGKSISIYDIAQIVNVAFTSSFSLSNITKGFEKTGIYPFNKNIFTQDDVLSSLVTNRLIPDSEPNLRLENNRLELGIVSPNVI
ncbi:uncharacterized protein LOC143913562 isoform X1 [Arctopsyche grandis]|uniref:uncharacterized protein LOC143913562 isoform X1 n=1 Tax=Arctopsyche grandis TaxID=121162 RepID=UPI00406D8151